MQAIRHHGQSTNRNHEAKGQPAAIRGIRATRLALCLASVLAPALVVAATPSGTISAAHPAPSRDDGHAPTAPQTWLVKNCSDHDTDSLRDVITNQAMPGDTVDLSHLPTLCGVADSAITLSTGEIKIAQQDLTLIGPAPGGGTVTVSGGGASRVFRHYGTGTLALISIAVVNGNHHVSGFGYGGCIASGGQVSLTSSRVSDCKVTSDSNVALGGGIYAGYDVAMIDSVVSGNQAVSGTTYAYGAGIDALTLTAKYSEISNNKATPGGMKKSNGGGASVFGTVGIYHSTIDNNTADYGSAVVTSGDTTIMNSTISRNNGTTDTVRLVSGVQVSLNIANSTIAFNHQASSSPSAGGVYFWSAQATDEISLQSSIIANNTAGPAGTAADVFVAPGHGKMTGADNLVMATNAAPAAGVITVITDPQLGPLQLNGGLLRTHLPAAGSPALGKGNHTMSFPPNDDNSADQRGAGYSRETTIGGTATVDLGAVQFDTIFVEAFETVP